MLLLCALALLCMSDGLVQASLSSHSGGRGEASALHALRGLADTIRAQLDPEASMAG